MLKGEAKTERLKAAQIHPTPFVRLIPWRKNIVPPTITPQNPKLNIMNNFNVNICKTNKHKNYIKKKIIKKKKIIASLSNSSHVWR